MKITIQDLIDKSACRNGKDWFEENFGEETDIKTLKNKLIKQQEWDYLRWVYRNFKLSGEYIDFYDNGQVWVKCFYKNGKLEGEFISFYDNGQVSEKCFFKYGKIEGIKTYYNEDSSIYCKEKYNNGEFIETKYY